MSHGGSYVESPKDIEGQSGADYHAGLDEIARRASASVAEGAAKQGAIEADTKREAGAKEEDHRAQTSAKASGEAEVGVALAENAMLPVAAKVVSNVVQGVSAAKTSAGNFTDKEAKGLGASTGAESVDAAFGRMKKSSNSIATGSGIESPTRGRCLLTKSNCVAKNLGDQRGTNVGTTANEQNSANLNTARTEVQSVGIANKNVLAQTQAMKAKNAHVIGQPTPGGAKAPELRGDARMAKGPAYISPEQAARMAEKLDTSDGSESWTG